MKIACCDCKMVLNHGTGEPGEKTSHTYCAICYGKAIADINAYFGRLEKQGTVVSAPSQAQPSFPEKKG